MSQVLVIKNARLEGPGTLGELLKSDGFDLQTILAKKEKIPSLDHAAVLVLGAPESANDDLQYLRDEISLILEAAQKNVPVLGICLGSQLMAKAFGARVYRGAKKEIGFYDDIKIDRAAHSRLFEGFDDPFSVFHWHGDTFDIPENAKRLAYSMYNQAFRYRSAVGIQFHLEVDGPTVRSWLDSTKEALGDINPKKILAEMDSHIETVQKNMRVFYKNFKSEFGL